LYSCKESENKKEKERKKERKKERENQRAGEQCPPKDEYFFAFLMY
jgi:hypothetical protein